MLQKLVKVQKTALFPFHPPSSGPTHLPNEKCIDHYRVVGIEPLSFPARAHESYSMFDVKVRRSAHSETGKNTPEANVKEPFHWLFDTPVSLPVSYMNTHTHFLSLSAAKSSLHFLRSPSSCSSSSSSISEAATVQKPHHD